MRNEELEIMITSKAEIVLQDDGGRDLINEGFVLTGFLFQATVNHCLMRQYGSETLVEILDRHLWNSLAPTVHELLHTLEVLTRLSVRLSGLSNNDALHRLPTHIGSQPVE